jgi:hypothetical protein
MRPSWLDTIDSPIQWVCCLPHLQRHHVSGPPRIVNGQDCAVDQLCVRLAELWFNTLQRRCLRRADFPSADALEAVITAFIATYKRLHAHPYRWTYSGDHLVA